MIKLTLTCLSLAVLLQNASTAAPSWVSRDLKSSSPQAGTEINYRLPNDTRPIRYDIYLSTNIHLADEENPEKFIFRGLVRIQVNILETTKVITIHARQLRILGARVLNENNEQVPWLNRNQPEYNPTTEHLTFSLRDYLYRDQKVILEIQYSGELREDAFGFYRSSYIQDGRRKWLAATQFQVMDARHAFPCYDEPQIQTPFGLSINHHHSIFAISNMPVRELIADGPGRTTTVFQDSPPMQTYLLAFVVSDFLYVSASTSKRDNRVYARKDAIVKGDGSFGLNACINILDYQERYFNISFPLPKIDQAAIPDFEPFAMENWGLLTYREEYLLYDLNKPSLIKKRSIAEIVSHELAHQFFGNLVAPKWWTYYWLNEGFATLYEYGFTAAVYPEFYSWDYFVASQTHGSMEMDATELTKPMTTYVNNPFELYTPAGFVNYLKAASILRMLQLTLGDDTFRRGVGYYLNEMRNRAAEADDLSRNLERAAKEDGRLVDGVQMKDIIDSWSTKSHYPVVEVSIGRNNRIELTQRQFKFSPEESEDLWLIPITLATEANPDFTNFDPVTWFGTRSTTLPAEWTAESWVILNLQQSGHYRVNYDTELWVRLIEKLQSPEFEDIHYLNRAQLVNDALSLARAGIISYKSALQVTAYLHQETEFVPWISADRGFNYMNRLLVDSENYDNFKLFINDMVSPLFANLTIEDGGESEPLPDKTSRNIAINWACLSGDESCNTATIEQIRETLRNPSFEIPGDLQFSVYCNGLRYAETEDFVNVWLKMQASTNQDFRGTLINALGCSQNVEAQKIYLDSTLETNPEKANYRNIEREGVRNAIYTYGGKIGAESVIEFIRDNYEEIEEINQGLFTPVKNMCRGVATFVTSPQMLEKYEETLDIVQEAGLISDAEREEFIAVSQENIDWVKANDEEIGEFLEEYFAQSKGARQITSNDVFKFSLIRLIHKF